MKTKTVTLILWAMLATALVALFINPSSVPPDSEKQEPTVISIGHLGTRVELRESEFTGDVERVIYTVEIIVQAHDETIRIPQVVNRTLNESSGFVVLLGDPFQPMQPEDGTFVGIVSSDAALLDGHFLVVPHTSRIFTIRGELSDFSGTVGMELEAIRFLLEESGKWVTVVLDDDPGFRTGLMHADTRRLGRGA